MAGPDAACDVQAEASDSLDTVRCATSLRHLSFEDNELFRGVPLAFVLQRLGSVLQESAGCAQDQVHVRKSEQDLDAFLSHNWSVSRFRKFLVLAFHSNLKTAWVLSLLMQVVSFTLVVFEVLPASQIRSIGGKIKFRSTWCSVFGFGVFWVVMLFSQDCSAVLKRTRPMVFLDKMSIHQNDVALRQKGIDSLAAFLAHSKVLVCVLGREYLQKLWTMFELCTFLSIHPLNSLRVQPIGLAMASTLGCLLMQITLVVWNLARVYHGSQTWVFYSFCGAWGIAVTATTVSFGWVMRWWGRERELLVQQANNFHIARADCLHEVDRAKVRAIIADFARDSKFLEKDGASTHDCVEAFEAQVRRLVPEALNMAFGPTGVPRRFAAVMLLPVVSFMMDDLSKHSSPASS